VLGAIDPTLSAILPLVGVVIGALAAGGTAYGLKRRDERNELRAASRVLLTDLYDAHDVLTLKTSPSMRDTVDDIDWSSVEDEGTDLLSTEAWKRHELLLARHLDDFEWGEVSGAFQGGAGRGPVAA
jgi:hypothetical protein